jgi:hypothetical protein
VTVCLINRKTGMYQYLIHDKGWDGWEGGALFSPFVSPPPRFLLQIIIFVISRMDIISTLGLHEITNGQGFSQGTR